MSDDIDSLERLARAATPGPWKWTESYGSVSLDRDVPNHDHTLGDHVLFAEPCGDCNSSVLVEDADAAYLAAVSPDVVLGLIALLRAAEEEIADLKDENAGIDVSARDAPR